MFLLVVIVNWSTPLVSAVMTWPAVGDVNGDRGGRVVDDERHLGVGIVGVGLVAALVDDPHPGHVVAAVVAGQWRQDAVGPDVVDAEQVGQRRWCW